MVVSKNKVDALARPDALVLVSVSEDVDPNDAGRDTVSFENDRIVFEDGISGYSVSVEIDDVQEGYLLNWLRLREKARLEATNAAE